MADRQPQIAVYLEEHPTRDELTLTITWRRGYAPDELAPEGLPGLIARICEGVAEEVLAARSALRTGEGSDG